MKGNYYNIFIRIITKPLQINGRNTHFYFNSSQCDRMILRLISSLTGLNLFYFFYISVCSYYTDLQSNEHCSIDIYVDLGDNYNLSQNQPDTIFSLYWCQIYRQLKTNCRLRLAL